MSKKVTFRNRISKRTLLASDVLCDVSPVCSCGALSCAQPSPAGKNISHVLTTNQRRRTHFFTMGTPLPSCVVTPWTNHDELLGVYDVIFPAENGGGEISEDKEEIESARNLLVVWKLRNPNSPDAIEFEVTAAILSARIQEEEWRRLPGSGTAFNDLNLASLYSAAVIKFCDALSYYQMTTVQNRRCIVRTWSRSNSGLNKIAQRLGVPSWVIDCRHDACHSSTPPLELLRKASRIALEWMRQHFWSKKIKTAESRTSVSCLQTAGLKPSLSRNKYISVDVISSAIISETVDKGIVWNDEVPDLSEHISNSLSANIAVVTKLGHLHLLLHKLITEFKAPNESRRQAAIACFMSIMKSATDKTSKSKLSIATRAVLMRHSNAAYNLVWKKLFYRLVKTPNKWTPALIDHFQKVAPLAVSDDDYEKTKKLASVFVGNNVAIDSGREIVTGYQVKTVEDLKSHVGEE